MSQPIIVPFLKWAGGKRWFVDQHRNLFPSSFKTYYEPFLGGAAAFFELRPKRAVLSDINPDLINVYQCISSNWKRLANELEEHQLRHSKSYYYRERSILHRSKYKRAAQFLYLNRTCWNGLYRVNLEGEFNLPIGTKNTVILDTDRFDLVSTLLRDVELACSDFECQIDSAKKNDFIFVDPPYTVKKNMNGFIKYNENLFSWEDQIRLRDALDRARSRGAEFLVTNANHRSVRDLYRDIGQLCSVSRVSRISGKVSAREPIKELVVRSWT